MQHQIGVDERLGEIIRLDLTFRDEHGRSLRLKDFIDKPTLLLPVYYHCPQACNLMLASLAGAIEGAPLTPGEDYRVLAVSFDEEETPALAGESKRNYIKLIEKPFPGNQWKFLTGEENAIRALLADLGYRMKKTGPHMFIHPNVMVVLSPEGGIIRYLYGVHFLPFDVGMALTEASGGTPRLSIRRALTYCFDYDAEKKTYVFKAFRVVAVSILMVLGIFLFFLLRGKKTPGAANGNEIQGQTQ